MTELSILGLSVMYLLPQCFLNIQQAAHLERKSDPYASRPHSLPYFQRSSI